jgi:hypothetical protein
MKKKTIKPVNIYDLQEMIALGYRNPLTPRDQTVWTKTPYEKRLIKQAKHRYKNYEFATSWGFKKPAIPCKAKLIIQIYKNPGFLKKNGYNKEHLTFSYVCGQSEIPYILSKFMEGDKSLIRWYKYNDKYYKASELPFYYW